MSLPSYIINWPELELDLKDLFGGKTIRSLRDIKGRQRIKGYAESLPALEGTFRIAEKVVEEEMRIILTGVTFSQSAWKGEDYWSLWVDDDKLFDTVYTKEIGDQKHWELIHVVKPEQTIKVLLHNVSGNSRNCWVDIEWVELFEPIEGGCPELPKPEPPKPEPPKPEPEEPETPPIDPDPPIDPPKPEPEPEEPEEPEDDGFYIKHKCYEVSDSNTVFGATETSQGVVKLGSSDATNSKKYKISFDRKYEIRIRIFERGEYEFNRVEDDSGNILANRKDAGIVDGMGGVSILVDDSVKSLVVVFKTYREPPVNPDNPSNPPKPIPPASDWEDTINTQTRVHFSGAGMSDRAFEGSYSTDDGRIFDMEATKLFVADKYSEILYEGEYPRASDVLIKSRQHTIDSLAIDKGTRLIFYSEPQFQGVVLLDMVGSAIIYNKETTSKYPQYAQDILMRGWVEPYNSYFPISSRGVVDFNFAYGVPMHNFYEGSFKIIKVQ